MNPECTMQVVIPGEREGDPPTTRPYNRDLDGDLQCCDVISAMYHWWRNGPGGLPVCHERVLLVRVV